MNDESILPAHDGETRTVEMLPGEKWWGLCNAFGREMPFSETTRISLDLRLENYAHQSLSLLCSDRGRAIWCPEPVGAEIADGRIRIASDGLPIEFAEHAGANLREAFRFASAKWFPPAGGEPDLLYFSAPQCNTWVELTYHQNERDILAYAQSMIDNGVPPGVFMIDDTWQLGYGTWEFDPRRFSDPKGMMAKLHAMGFKVLLWICPFVSMDSPEYRALLGPGEDGPGAFLCALADERGALREHWCNDPAAVKWWNGKSALLDFTHPNARRWFAGELARLRRDYGADGFKFDGGSVHFYAGCTGAEGSATRTLAFDPSVSPAAQSALYGAFALANPGSEYRNGFGFAGRPVIMRLHDKPHTWEALRRLVPDMLAAGLVGCPFICPDMVGGGEWTAFLPGAPFEPELFLRSAQVHALCPMMQLSVSPWRVLSEEHRRLFKDILALRQRFAPRFVELARESARTGEPMMRNLEYVFPGRGCADIRDEFLMGDDLLVAPVLEKGATSRAVVLPPGSWRADDGSLLEGPATVEVSAPLARLPHFERVR